MESSKTDEVITRQNRLHRYTSRVSNFTSKVSNFISDKKKPIAYMLYACVFFGIIISFFANNSQNKNDDEITSQSLIDTVATGYIMSGAALLILIPFTILGQKEPPSDGNSLRMAIYNILIQPMPTYITMISFILASVQLMYFKDRLIKHHVANEYYTWTNSFTVLIIIQTIILAYHNIFNKNTNSSLGYVLYLIGLFNIIILGIIQIILYYFSTDG